MIRMAEYMTAGVHVDDPAVQTEVDIGYQSVCRMWTPDAAAFKNLGQRYVVDPGLAATYNSIAPRLAEYYRDAMTTFADTRLT